MPHLNAPLSDVTRLAGFVQQRLLHRNAVSRPIFAREAPRLARVCQSMAERFLRAGRLLAFGRGACATDAQHVSVEFVHPIIVGKRALPALDLSLQFEFWMESILRPDDIVMGFGPPGGDPDVTSALDTARRRGALTLALPGTRGDYTFDAGIDDAFVHQEVIEVLYHTLWETVHVFFEHQDMGMNVGQSGFLYPFLGHADHDPEQLLAEVTSSIVSKAADDESLRERVATQESDLIAEAVTAIHGRVARGGTLILFGNGGSATDANDWAIDCASPPAGYRRIPAISLAMEPANITAIANDVGRDAVFLRQLIAHARPGDVAIAISTSGGSPNVRLALQEARQRGLLTVALLGYDGGEIARRDLADFSIVVRSDYVPRIQEVQASVYHVMCDALQELTHG